MIEVVSHCREHLHVVGFHNTGVAADRVDRRHVTAFGECCEDHDGSPYPAGVALDDPQQLPALHARSGRIRSGSEAPSYPTGSTGRRAPRFRPSRRLYKHAAAGESALSRRLGNRGVVFTGRRATAADLSVVSACFRDQQIRNGCTVYHTFELSSRPDLFCSAKLRTTSY